MTLTTTIRQRVLEHAPFHDHVEHIVATEGGITVRCDVSGAQSLGMALLKMELAAAPGALELDELTERIARLCDRVHYLLEPLRTIEVDQAMKRILARSATPRVKGATLSYYELVATAEQRVDLRRYAFHADRKRREPVEFLVTPEQFELLVDDLLSLTAGSRR